MACPWLPAIQVNESMFWVKNRRPKTPSRKPERTERLVGMARQMDPLGFIGGRETEPDTRKRRGSQGRLKTRAEHRGKMDPPDLLRRERGRRKQKRRPRSGLDFRCPDVRATARIVICFVISVSVVTSLVFFSALLLVAGPSGQRLAATRGRSGEPNGRAGCEIHVENHLSETQDNDDFQQTMVRTMGSRWCWSLCPSTATCF